MLEEIQNNLFNQAKLFRDNNTYTISNYDDFKKQINEGGFVQCGWDGLAETEEKIILNFFK